MFRKCSTFLLSIQLLVASGLSGQAGLKPEALNAPDPELTLLVSEFHALWQNAWRVSEQSRRRLTLEEPRRWRHVFGHCDVEPFLQRGSEIALIEGKANGFPAEYYQMVRSAHSRFGVCPTWLLDTAMRYPEDETHWRDAALTPAQRATVSIARQQVINKLQNAYSRDSGNEWISGQLLRLTIDNRDWSSAQKVVTQCAAAQWWCEALQGMVYGRTGRMLLADSAFARMRRAMPDVIRCEWENAVSLLPYDFRQQYVDATCANQELLNSRIWWLADPLLREPGNARLVEQEMRRMDIVLRRATLQDERYPFDDARGGDAIVKLIERYGWPSYTAALDSDQERQHSRYLRLNHHSLPTPPYTTFEYTVDRIRAFPSKRVLNAPFEATALDWKIAMEDSLGRLRMDWWPDEHFRPHRRLVQLPDGQTVVVRRQSHVEVAVALPLSHPLMQGSPLVFDVLLLSTISGAIVDSIDRVHVNGGMPAFLRGTLKYSPTLLAIEAAGVGGANLDGRTRYARTAPGPLAELVAGDIAMSDIALLSPINDVQVRAPTDSLLRLLLPDVRLPRERRRIAVYWESYGTLPTDSNAIELRIASDNDLSFLRRIGIAGGIVSDPGSTLAIRWTSQAPRGGTSTLGGPVPMQMHALSLDLNALRPGPYTVEVILTSKDKRVTSSRTKFELLR
jgi:hypothetical protein